MGAGKGRSRRCWKRKTKEEEEAEEEEDVCFLATLLITKQQHTALILYVILHAETLKSCHCTFDTRFAGLCRCSEKRMHWSCWIGSWLCFNCGKARWQPTKISDMSEIHPVPSTATPQQTTRRATKFEFSPIPKWVVWLKNQIRNWLKTNSVPG